MADRKPWPVLLIVRELDYGGTERQFTEIAKRLDRSRFTPHVGCFITVGMFEKELREREIPIVRFHVPSLASPAVLSSARQMGQYIRRHQIKLVHTFDVPGTIFGVFASRFFGAPVVLSSQRAHRGLTPGIYRHLLRLSDGVADGIVVNCQAMRRHLIEDEKVPGARIHLCYNSVDTEVFHPRRDWMPAQLEGASLVIGVACVLRPEKGVHNLIEAFSRVRNMCAGARLLILGDGPCLLDLTAQVRALGLENYCVILPPVVDIERWLPLFDIFVLPSLSEALSNSLMEAMASGCCVVASDVGGNGELVLDERTGLLFASGDVDGLTARLRRLIEDRALREKLGAAGLEWISGNFSRAASLAKVEETYSRYLRNI